MNVSRVYRLLKLITLLQGSQVRDADMLAGELGISRRTFFRDLKLLQHAGVPYRFDSQANGYAISDSFFLPPLHLDLQEALALLLLTKRMLSRQIHPSYQKALDAALKIESILPRDLVRHCGELLQGVEMRWPAASSSDAVAGVFNVLQTAIAGRRRVKIRYDSIYDRREIDAAIEPQRLLFMARGWYVIAVSQTHGDLRTYKLDRILIAQMTDEAFIPRNDAEVQAHFGAAWQMIPEGRLYDVKLRFLPSVAASVEEVLWHASQSTSRLEDDSLLFEARVDGIHEISAWVLSYGDQVEVLDPPELRARVRERAQGILALAEAVENNGNHPLCGS